MTRSWVPVPNDSDFPLDNLPYGVFRTAEAGARVGVAIGDHVLDLALLHEAGKLRGLTASSENLFARDSLNAFLAQGRGAWRAVRRRLQEVLSFENPELRDDAALRARALVPRQAAELLIPARIGDYTDFYSSLEHATNVGSMFRDPANPLLPNWRHLPVGYHGRASSIVVSGTPVRRPRGQFKPDEAERPEFGPSRLLDFELEMGFLTGPGNPLGEPVPIARAAEHIFGMVLVNDWSARDIQKWEYVPLGPFLAKSFATTISPWVVPMEALEPFRVRAREQDPPPLPYLQGGENDAYDIGLEAWLQPGHGDPVRISRTHFRGLYWTITQQLAHQTVNGVNLRPGDLYASGTVSGSDPGTYGSLLELTWKGTRPLVLPGGVTRKFLEDGDTVILRATCERDGLRLGFGECRGTILPALGP